MLSFHLGATNPPRRRKHVGLAAHFTATHNTVLTQGCARVWSSTYSTRRRGSVAARGARAAAVDAGHRSFPDGQSCLNLAAARLRYIAGTIWSAKCYMNMRPLYQPQVVQTEAVA
jgi:hypothetical protein